MKKSAKESKNKKNNPKAKKNLKIKKVIIASLAVILCVITVLLVIFCEPKHPIEKFSNKMLKNRNFQMDVALIGIPILGSVSFAFEVDGDIMHMPQSTFTSESYFESVDGTHYTYTKDEYNRWIKEKNEADSLSDFLESEIFQQLINSDNYEPVEGKKKVYRQKPDVEFERCRNVTIKLENDSCKIEMIAEIDGMVLETHILISKIDEMNLKLPTAIK